MSGAVLFVGADKREFGGILATCPAVAKVDLPVHWARTCEWSGRRILMVANGAGPLRAVSAVEAARAATHLDAVVSLGFCGALETGLKVGEIFVADAIDAGGRRLSVSVPSSLLAHRCGLLASVDRVAQTADDKRQLRALGAAAVEMEAAGIAAKTAEWGVPVYCVRAVTDLAEESFAVDFNAALRADGKFDTLRLLSSALRRPQTRVPELLRLQRRCRIAARSLGEFVADCRF